jgi:hypothetical protein
MPTRLPDDFMSQSTWQTLLAAMPPSRGQAQWCSQSARRPPEACPSFGHIDTDSRRAPPNTPAFLYKVG